MSNKQKFKTDDFRLVAFLAFNGILADEKEIDDNRIEWTFFDLDRVHKLNDEFIRGGYAMFYDHCHKIKAEIAKDLQGSSFSPNLRRGYRR